MLRVGLTGGIASGKTMVASIFSHYDVPIYYSDQRAKYIIEHDATVKQQIISTFGPESYKDGRYNTTYIASIVFNDSASLEQLNAIVHPAVYVDQKQFFAKHQKQEYVLVESALLFETKQQKQYDLIIVVAADRATRIQRIMQRDHLSKEEANLRIAKQLPQEVKIAGADYVIWNDATSSLLEQCQNIHRLLLAQAGLFKSAD